MSLGRDLVEFFAPAGTVDTTIVETTEQVIKFNELGVAFMALSSTILIFLLCMVWVSIVAVRASNKKK